MPAEFGRIGTPCERQKRFYAGSTNSTSRRRQSLTPQTLRNRGVGQSLPTAVCAQGNDGRSLARERGVRSPHGELTPSMREELEQILLTRSGGRDSAAGARAASLFPQFVSGQISRPGSYAASSPPTASSGGSPNIRRSQRRPGPQSICLTSPTLVLSLRTWVASARRRLGTPTSMSFPKTYAGSGQVSAQNQRRRFHRARKRSHDAGPPELRPRANSTKLSNRQTAAIATHMTAAPTDNRSIEELKQRTREIVVRRGLPRGIGKIVANELNIETRTAQRYVQDIKNDMSQTKTTPRPTASKAKKSKAKRGATPRRKRH